MCKSESLIEIEKERIPKCFDTKQLVTKELVQVNKTYRVIKLDNE